MGDKEDIERAKKRAQIESLRVYVLRVMSNGTRTPSDWIAPTRDAHGRYVDFALEA